MISSLKTLFRHEDNVFLVLRKMPTSYFHKGDVLNQKLFTLWREHIGANAVLKVQDQFLFCERIEELEEIIEEQIKIEQNGSNVDNPVGLSGNSPDNDTGSGREIVQTTRGNKRSRKRRSRNGTVSK